MFQLKGKKEGAQRQEGFGTLQPRAKPGAPPKPHPRAPRRHADHVLIQTRVKFSGQKHSCICMGECQTELGLRLWSAGVILERGGGQQKEQPVRVGRRERFKSGFDSALVFG